MATVLRVDAEVGRTAKSALTISSIMPTMLEVEPEVASKIQARARERGVSVDVYLRELIDEKRTASERSNGLSPQQRVRMLREWASGHSSNTPLLSDEAISRTLASAMDSSRVRGRV